MSTHKRKKNEKVKYIEILHKLQSTYVSYLLYKLPEKKSSKVYKLILSYVRVQFILSFTFFSYKSLNFEKFIQTEATSLLNFNGNKCKRILHKQCMHTLFLYFFRDLITILRKKREI